jgi:hypothetical protein
VRPCASRSVSRSTARVGAFSSFRNRALTSSRAAVVDSSPVATATPGPPWSSSSMCTGAVSISRTPRYSPPKTVKSPPSGATVGKALLSTRTASVLRPGFDNAVTSRRKRA